MNTKTTQKFAAILLLAAGAGAAQTLAGGGSIGGTAFDSVRFSLVNTAPPSPIAPSCTVTASLANVTPGATLTPPLPTGDCPICPPARARWGCPR